MNKLLSAGIALNFLLLAACSGNAPVANNQAGTVSKEAVVTVRQGTIRSIKKVSIMGRQGNAAGTVGSVTGSILGASGTIAGSLIGSMIGGAIGSEADREFSKKPGLELNLQLENGENVVVTQLATQTFKVGDRVRLTMRDNIAEVSHL